MRQAVGEQRADQGGAAADDPALGPVAELLPGEVLPGPPLLELPHRVGQLVGVEAERVPQRRRARYGRTGAAGATWPPASPRRTPDGSRGSTRRRRARARSRARTPASLGRSRPAAQQLRRGLPGGRLLQVAQREGRVVDAAGLAHVRVARHPDGAGGDRRRAAEEARLLKHRHAQPGVGGDGRRHQAPGPGSDDDHVVRLRKLRIPHLHQDLHRTGAPSVPSWRGLSRVSAAAAR